ncbi:MAG: transposase [Elusimicrobia bacterium]|nr:transposase [Elusimicrobiota bacterium]
MARGVNRCAIFIDDCDRTNFLDRLFRIASDSSCEIIAYCLMGNHFHLAIRVRHIPLAAIMLRFLTGYAKSFNRLYDRTGHLFQARHEANLCLDDAYLLSLVRYIHMNPVRAGLVSRPQDWPWSSSSRQPPGNSEGDLSEFDPWLKDEIAPDLIRLEHSDRRELADIGAEIAALTGIPLEELRSESRARRTIAAKRRFAREAARQGHRLIVLARWLNLDQSSVGRYIRNNTADTARPDTKIISSR